METFEKKLLAMEVPRHEDAEFENELRFRLLNDFFEPARKYRLKLRLALAAAALLAVFSVSLVAFPRLAFDLHALAVAEDSSMEPPASARTIPASFNAGARSAEVPGKSMPYTTIHHPGLARKIDPSLYEEEKAYVIRKYTSRDNEALMIVSEFDKPGKADYAFASY